MNPGNRRKWMGVAFMAATMGLAACGGGGGDPLLRQTAQGAIQGVDDAARSGTWFWKGIPFAKPPEGDLRWRAPVAPDRRDGVLAATDFGASCIQNPRLYSPGNNNTFDATVGDNLKTGFTPGSEGCLSLNIWRPADDERPLPVIVFIYGGSNVSGYSADPLYDGATLAREAHAVVVTANYRLGQLGFFRHAALRDTRADPTLSADDASGNYAVLDIFAALRFVQDNIADFGGDPGNVTLAGQSAGAINILAALTAPNQRARGLFHKLVPLSGGVSVAGSPGFPQPANDLMGNDGYIPMVTDTRTYDLLGNMLLLKLLIADGTAADAAAATAWVQAHDNTDIAAYLRSQPARILLEVGRQTVGGLPATTASGPIPEGTVVATDPIAAIRNGEYARVPVLSGMTASESKLLSSFLPLIGQAPGIQLADADLFATLFDAQRVASARFADIINPAYPDAARYDAAIAELDKKFFIANRDNLLDALATQTPQQVWSYQFDWRQEAAPWSDIYGAAHLFDIPFLLGNFGPSLYANVITSGNDAAGREQLSATMIAALARFAHAGDPNTPALGTRWPNWPRVLHLDADSGKQLISVR